MLKYSRNKLVSIVRKDQETLWVHGVLDDDIYSLEINVLVRISDLTLLSVDGKWNRWTTPECKRAEPILHEAEGFCIEAGLDQKIHKIIGRRACRHFANILIECCDSAKEAANLARWEDAKETKPELTLAEFMGNNVQEVSKPVETHHIQTKEKFEIKDNIKAAPVRKKTKGKLVIDLHVHTSFASPCSSAPVDQLIEEAKKIGLDGICLTDHNYVWEQASIKALRHKHDFMVLRGNEITTNQGDMLVFGFDENIQGIIKLEELAEKVKKANGFIIVAHPFRGFLTFNVGELGLTPEKAMERPLFNYVDAVEVLNGKVTEKENGFAGQVAKGLGLPVTGGSDAHEVFEVGRYATRFFSKINDENDLVNALKTGDFEPVVFRK